MRHTRDIGIAHQGEDGVIEGGGGDLDLAASREFLVRRQNFRYDFALFRSHELLVRKRVVAPFAHQFGDFPIVFQELFVEPGELRKHL